MAKTARKSKKSAAAMIVFSRSRDIPFNRIRLSDSNVRETDTEAGLDDLTHDIDRREDIVQGINVRAILDADGNETGDFETPAGGRRFRAIARLVEAGRFPADGLVPCLVKKADAKTSAVDDSLAENTLRLALHPLDQFRAFKRMFDDGMAKEEIADAWRTTPRYITQRMRLASVSPALLEVYARNGMTLAMLEAFTVNPDHARQEQVWEAIQRSYNVRPWQVRQLFTETTVPTDDKRVRFVGVDAYEQAGGAMLRDLFSESDGGWLEDVALLDHLVAEKLKTIADEVATEGWKWIAVDTSHPYGYDNGLREITGSFPELTDEERARKLRSSSTRSKTACIPSRRCWSRRWVHKMKVVVALGGNALLKRGEPMTAEVQRTNVRKAAVALADLARHHDIVVAHGNGPQVGLLALQAAAYTDVAPYPLDILGAESVGMIGYLVEQELTNALPPNTKIATLLTQIEVDGNDPAFSWPEKPIGPVYDDAEAAGVRKIHGWPLVEEAKGKWRRVVPSPLPRRITQIEAIRLLVDQNVVVVCAGGGGIPVIRNIDDDLEGVEAVIDKDRSAGLLAEQLTADAFLMLTDVDAVYANWGTQQQKPIRHSTPGDLSAQSFAAGSMGPKVEAACAFASVKGRTAGIGRLEDAREILEGRKGTVIRQI